MMKSTVRLCDRLVKGLMKLADKETPVLVVSDPGNAPNQYNCNLLRRLVDVGLTVVDEKENVDMLKSQAYPEPHYLKFESPDYPPLYPENF